MKELVKSLFLTLKRKSPTKKAGQKGLVQAPNDRTVVMELTSINDCLHVSHVST